MTCPARNQVMSQDIKAPQTLLSALRDILRNAVLLGILAASVGAAAGYIGSGSAWAGALRGMNWASLALAVYAGMIVVGHGQVRQIDRNAHLQHLRTDAALQGGYPWAAILTAFLASLTCGGLWWLLRAALNG